MAARPAAMQLPTDTTPSWSARCQPWNMSPLLSDCLLLPTFGCVCWLFTEVLSNLPSIFLKPYYLVDSNVFARFCRKYLPSTSLFSQPSWCILLWNDGRDDASPPRISVCVWSPDCLLMWWKRWCFYGTIFILTLIASPCKNDRNVFVLDLYRLLLLPILLR